MVYHSDFICFFHLASRIPHFLCFPLTSEIASLTPGMGPALLLDSEVLPRLIAWSSNFLNPHSLFGDFLACHGLGSHLHATTPKCISLSHISPLNSRLSYLSYYLDSSFGCLINILNYPVPNWFLVLPTKKHIFPSMAFLLFLEIPSFHVLMLKTI